MTLVGLLTLEQYYLLLGMPYDDDSYFNPIQDADDNWIISVEEIESCVIDTFQWVKQLPLIEYKPKQQSFV